MSSTRHAAGIFFSRPPWMGYVIADGQARSSPRSGWHCCGNVLTFARLKLTVSSTCWGWPVPRHGTRSGRDALSAYLSWSTSPMPMSSLLPMAPALMSSSPSISGTSPRMSSSLWELKLFRRIAGCLPKRSNAPIASVLWWKDAVSGYAILRSAGPLILRRFAVLGCLSSPIILSVEPDDRWKRWGNPIVHFSVIGEG